MLNRFWFSIPGFTLFIKKQIPTRYINTGTIHWRDAVYWVRATLKFSMRFSAGLAWKATIWYMSSSLCSTSLILFWSTHLQVSGNLLQVTCYFWCQVIVEQLRVLLTNTLVDITGKPKRDTFRKPALEVWPPSNTHGNFTGLLQAPDTSPSGSAWVCLC